MTISGQKHLFSAGSADYSRFRPTYPEALFDWLVTIAPRKDAVWDCATGSGQAAVPLAARFARVFATDLSEKQLAQAPRAAHIEYRRGTAEESGLSGASVDLVTVAQALHWFVLPRFLAEAKRVSRPGAALAVWTYALSRIDPMIDREIRDFYDNVVGPYWESERRLVDQGYRTLVFPFEELMAPEFEMRQTWSLGQLVGYLRTWSSVQTMRNATGRDPVSELEPRLRAVWGNAADRAVSWPIAVRAFRIS